MNTITANTAPDRSSFLRRVLLVDAATCAATGALMSAASAPLASLLGLPPALLLWSGLALFPVAAFMLFVATRRHVPVVDAWIAILGNAGWVAGSALVLLLCAPTALGYAFVIAQAAAVALLAELELAGLRRLR